MVLLSQQEVEKATSALKYIIPILENHKLNWLIPGGFASLVYGVDRSLTDIDIDIEASVNDVGFRHFLAEIQPYVTEPLNHFTDQNYDNYNVEATYSGQVLDTCPAEELKVYDQTSKHYIRFYTKSLPTPEIVDFYGLRLPLLPKELIIKNKQTLIWQRESDRRDIAGLQP